MAVSLTHAVVGSGAPTKWPYTVSRKTGAFDYVVIREQGAQTMAVFLAIVFTLKLSVEKTQSNGYYYLVYTSHIVIGVGVRTQWQSLTARRVLGSDACTEWLKYICQDCVTSQWLSGLSG